MWTIYQIQVLIKIKNSSKIILEVSLILISIAPQTINKKLIQALISISHHPIINNSSSKISQKLLILMLLEVVNPNNPNKKQNLNQTYQIFQNNQRLTLQMIFQVVKLQLNLQLLKTLIRVSNSMNKRRSRNYWLLVTNNINSQILKQTYKEFRSNQIP